MDVHFSRQQIFLYRVGTRNRYRPKPTACTAMGMRSRAIQREISRGDGGRFLAPGFGCSMPRVGWLRRYRTTVFANEPRFRYKGDDSLL